MIMSLEKGLTLAWLLSYKPVDKIYQQYVKYNLNNNSLFPLDK